MFEEVRKNLKEGVKELEKFDSEKEKFAPQGVFDNGETERLSTEQAGLDSENIDAVREKLANIGKDEQVDLLEVAVEKSISTISENKNNKSFLEKFFTIDRVVGKASREEKIRVIEQKKEIFRNQQFDDLKGFEVKKSPEVMEAIDFANKVTNELRVKYGLDELDIPAQNIHVLNSLKSESPLSFAEGSFSDETLRILIAEKTLPQFTSILVHEILHMKTQHSFDGDKDKNRAHKGGLIIRSRKKRFRSAEYFSVLNEAMTEMVTKRIVLNAIAKNDPLFKDLATDTQEASEKYPEATDSYGRLIFDDHLFYAKENKDGFLMKILLKMLREEVLPVYACRFAYQREQDILNGLIDKIFERNKGNFNNREEIYLLFEKSYVTGDMVKIGMLIDQTFGAGTFRKLGVLSPSIIEDQDQKDFLEAL